MERQVESAPGHYSFGQLLPKLQIAILWRGHVRGVPPGRYSVRAPSCDPWLSRRRWKSLAKIGLLKMVSSEWAAWVQAIGSVLGIAVAVAVPTWIHFQEKARDRAKDAAIARDHAIVIGPALKQWLGDCRHHIERLNEDDFGEWQVMHSVANFDNLTRVPKPVLGRLGQLHELADAAGPVQRLIHIHSLVLEARPGMARLSAVGALGDWGNNEEAAREKVDFVALIHSYFTALENAEKAVLSLLS